jgi:hypothetical protein
MYEDEYGRSGSDRRSGFDRRDNSMEILPRGIDERSGIELRDGQERRAGWVNVTQWSSTYIGIPITDLRPENQQKEKALTHTDL